MNSIKTLLQKNKEPLIMGILNITPDSFSDGGKFIDPTRALNHTEIMIKNGIDIIDIGAESSRPGAKKIPISLERERIEPVLKAIKKNFNIPVSIDTYKAEIMQLGIDHGAEMINDIYALGQPGSMETVLKSDTMLCLMHMQGTPQDMQDNPSYKNVTEEVRKFLKERINICKKFGIDESRIILDPGFGFGKTYENNLKLFQSIDKLNSLEKPLLIGISRKKMIRKIVGNTENDIIHGSAIMAAISVLRGARIVRVHDIQETKNALRILQLKEK